jgi:hypothetical protein
MRRAVYMLLGGLLLGGAWPSPARADSFAFSTIAVPGALTTFPSGL